MKKRNNIIIGKTISEILTVKENNHCIVIKFTDGSAIKIVTQMAINPFEITPYLTIETFRE